MPAGSSLWNEFNDNVNYKYGTHTISLLILSYFVHTLRQLSRIMWTLILKFMVNVSLAFHWSSYCQLQSYLGHPHHHVLLPYSLQLTYNLPGQWPIVFHHDSVYHCSWRWVDTIITIFATLTKFAYIPTTCNNNTSHPTRWHLVGHSWSHLQSNFSISLSWNTTALGDPLH